MAQKHISKDGRGRITSKITKPKDWAYRTPSEGRAKHVHSPRAKKIKMAHSIWHDKDISKMLLAICAGTRHCQWNISCENPARKLTAQDVLDVIHGLRFHFQDDDGLEIKCNEKYQIFIFVDLSDILTGTREEPIAPALTKDEIEIAKRHVSEPVCEGCGSYKSVYTCKSKRKENENFL